VQDELNNSYYIVQFCFPSDSGMLCLRSHQQMWVCLKYLADFWGDKLKKLSLSSRYVCMSNYKVWTKCEPVRLVWSTTH